VVVVVVLLVVAVVTTTTTITIITATTYISIYQVHNYKGAVIKNPPTSCGFLSFLLLVNIRFLEYNTITKYHHGFFVGLLFYRFVCLMLIHSL